MYWTYRAGAKRLSTQFISIVTGVLEAPATIDNLTAWFDADSSYITLNGSDVATWTDRHNGYEVTATGSFQPSYENSLLNGRPSIYFDKGSSEELKTQDNNFLTAFSGSQKVTIFVVLKREISGAGSSVIWSFDTPSGQIFDSYIAGGNGALFQRVTTGAQLEDDTYNYEDDQFHIIVYKTGGGNSERYIRKDGNYVKIQSFGSQELEEPDVFRIGSNISSATLGGYISELLFYNRTLTDEEVDTVETYLFNKYFSVYNFDSLVAYYQFNSGSSVEAT